MKPADQQPPKRRTRTWVKIVLALSLALNLMVVGLVLGAGANRYHDDDDTRRSKGGEVFSYGPYSRALPPEARDRMIAGFRERAPEFRVDRSTLRKSFRELQEALRAVPYDPVVVEGILDRQRAHIDGQVALARELFLKEVADMSDAERAELADNLRRVIRKGPPKGAPPPGSRP